MEHEAALRLAAFVGVLGTLLVLQWRFAFRGDGRPAKRQATHAGLVLVDTLMLRFAFPVLAVGAAAAAHGSGFGLLPALDAPTWANIAVSLLVLDLVIYWQHRLLHRIPLLWRMHRVHHADTAFDVTTGVRFHPLEIAFSMGIKIGTVVLLGAHPAGVLIFEIVLSAGSLWTHTDIALPERVDRAVRRVWVTPSMHRIHHSTWRPETDSNYGFHLTIWDRLFRSYRAQPREPEREMKIGLDRWRDDRDQGLWALLVNPFSRGGRD